MLLSIICLAWSVHSLFFQNIKFLIVIIYIPKLMLNTQMQINSENIRNWISEIGESIESIYDNELEFGISFIFPKSLKDPSQIPYQLKFSLIREKNSSYIKIINVNSEINKNRLEEMRSKFVQNHIFVKENSEDNNSFTFFILESLENGEELLKERIHNLVKKMHDYLYPIRQY